MRARAPLRGSLRLPLGVPDSSKILRVKTITPDSDPEIRVRRIDDVRSRSLFDEAVLLNEPQQLYFGVNTAGNLLWSAMVDVVTLQSLAELLVSTFGIARDQAWNDTVRFVSELQRNELLQVLE